MTVRYLINAIKTILPVRLISFIRQALRRRMAIRVSRQHKSELDRIGDKKNVRVIFLVIHDSVWKVDAVFRQMTIHPRFEPIILVCPYILDSKKRMLENIDKTYAYFIKRRYKVVSSYSEKDDSWIDLESLNPDILFFTNPHNLTIPEYYANAYTKYLSCYVPYAFEVSQYSGNQSQYNQYFHNAMWKIFSPHNCSKNTYKITSAIKGRNVSVTGYPGIEDIIAPCKSTDVAVWKGPDDKKTRIIWAPHHTVDSPEIPYSNFLKYFDLFRSLTEEYRDTTQWVFKPHPILKSKLYKHVDWGVKKTDLYYNFWETQENTQLELGEYSSLFLESDALIHDSGSFLAEYLFVEKPVLYLVATDNYQSYYNDFGKEALSSSRLAFDEHSIRNFITSVISGSFKIKDEHRLFIKKYCIDKSSLPSNKIINEIESAIYCKNNG